ncbi:MAG TPA: abortive infection protein, partial [Microcoleaceae bacterium UBA10368]|nr:abortive infection protein [Microcoleaceae cyanobacterium UBA10368]
MTVSFLILPQIILLSGQSFDQLILGLGLIILTGISGLTTFIFIRIFINWWQAIAEQKRQVAQRAIAENDGYSTDSISRSKSEILEPLFIESDGDLTTSLFGDQTDVAELIQQPIIICEDPVALAQLYQPIALWQGRLILPTDDQRKPYGSVFLQVINTPKKYRELIGKTAILNLSTNRKNQFFVHAVTQDIKFTKQTENSKKSGKIHPDRLKGWRNVGPLETLAGSRLEDSVTVMLRRPVNVINYDSSDRHEL